MAREDPNDRAGWSAPWLLAVAVATGAALRFATLDLQSFGHDEAVTAGRVLMPSLAETFDTVGSSERTPHLYYLVAWIWSRPFGVGEVGLRSLSALLGTATIPFAYLAARSLVSRHAGLITAWLVAVSPFLVYYSQEARTYALVTFLGAVALWFFARSRREPTTRDLAGWAVLSCLALSAHYFAAFPFLAEAAFLIWRSRERTRVVLSAAVPVVVGLAFLPLALDQGGGHDAGGAVPGYREVMTVAVQFVAGQRLGIRGAYTLIPLVGTLLYAGAAGLILIAWRRRATGAFASGLVALSTVAGPLLLVGAGGDELGGEGIFSAKNAVGAVVPITVLAGYGLSLLPGLRLQALATAAAYVAMAAIVIAATVVTGLQRPDWRAVAKATDSARPRAIVAGAGGDDPLLYYLRHRNIRRMSTGGANLSSVSVAITAPGATPEILSRVFTPGQESRLDGFVISGYRAPKPAAVTPDQLKSGSDQTVLVIAAP